MYSPEINLKFKSREILFAPNIHLNCQIFLKTCKEHGSDVVVLCVKFQND